MGILSLSGVVLPGSISYYIDYIEKNLIKFYTKLQDKMFSTHVTR